MTSSKLIFNSSACSRIPWVFFVWKEWLYVSIFLTNSRRKKRDSQLDTYVFFSYGGSPVTQNYATDSCDFFYYYYYLKRKLLNWSYLNLSKLVQSWFLKNIFYFFFRIRYVFSMLAVASHLPFFSSSVP